jgi:hypothetical protein
LGGGKKIQQSRRITTNNFTQQPGYEMNVSTLTEQMNIVILPPLDCFTSPYRWCHMVHKISYFLVSQTSLSPLSLCDVCGDGGLGWWVKSNGNCWAECDRLVSLSALNFEGDAEKSFN